MHTRLMIQKKQNSEGGIPTLCGFLVNSEKLNFSDICDVVEFHRDPQGMLLLMWKPPQQKAESACTMALKPVQRTTRGYKALLLNACWMQAGYVYCRKN